MGSHASIRRGWRVEGGGRMEKWRRGNEREKRQKKRRREKKKIE